MIQGFTAAWLAMAMMSAGQQDNFASARVAVVSIGEVSEKYQRTTELESFFDGQRSQFQKTRDEQKQKIERMTKSLQEELKSGTPEFRERAKQITMMEAELKWFVESEGQRLEEGLKSSLRSIYKDMLVVVREVADAKKLDLVVASDRMPESLPESPNQLRQQILLQKVVYWTPRVDITAEVIQRLNERHQSNPQRIVGEPPAATAAPVKQEPPKAAKKP